MLYDVIIIGGGPAGCAAAVYTARKRLKTLLIADSFGGQSIVSDDIQNWIGEPHISGFELAQKFEAHIRAFPDVVDIKTERANMVAKKGDGFEVRTEQGNAYEGSTVILGAGARRRKLGILGEDAYNGKGVAYCSTCDAPLFSGKKIVVVGSGNAGLEAVQDLFPYASEIYLLEKGGAVRGDQLTHEEIQKNPKLKQIIFHADSQEIIGNTFVTGLKYRDTETGEEHTLAAEGIFIEIGSIPNSEMVKDLVERDPWGQVKIDSKHGTTSCPGVFAAGDITDDPYKQNNISAGDAVKAALAAYDYILKKKSGN
ncbi:MAG: FAD-dependent oxidoreductase [Patescibacteria group bacterium]